MITRDVSTNFILMNLRSGRTGIKRGHRVNIIEFDRAAEEYKRAIEIDPHEAETHYCLGLAYWNQGRYAEALEEHKRAAEIDSSYADALRRFERAYQRGEGAPLNPVEKAP